MSKKKYIILFTEFKSQLSKKVLRYFSSKKEIKEIVILADEKDLNKTKNFIKNTKCKISVIKADISKIDFGISGKDYFQEAKKITHIFHLTDPIKSSLDARVCAREIVEFGMVCDNLEHIIAISGFNVAGNYTGTFCEHDLEMGQSFTGNKSRLLFQTERIYHRFSPKLPVTIIRTGYLSNHSSNPNSLAEILCEQKLNSQDENKTPYFSRLECIKKAVISVFSNPPGESARVLHLVMPDVAPMKQLFKTADEIMKQISPPDNLLKPYNFWNIKISTEELKKSLLSAKISTSFTDDYLSESSK